MARRLGYWLDDLISPSLKLELVISKPADLPSLLPSLQSVNWLHTSKVSPLLLPPNLSRLTMRGGTDWDQPSWYHSTVGQSLRICGRLQSLTLQFTTNGILDTSPECRDAATALVDFLCQAWDIEEFELGIQEYLSEAVTQLLSLMPRLASLHLRCSNHIPVLFEYTVPPRFSSLTHLSLSAPISMLIDFARFKFSLSSFNVFFGICTLEELEKWLMGSNGCYGRNLRILSICGELEEDVWGGSGLANFVSGIALIKLTLHISVDFTDQTLIDLGSALPYL
jgi:hypothetical protein